MRKILLASPRGTVSGTALIHGYGDVLKKYITALFLLWTKEKVSRDFSFACLARKSKKEARNNFGLRARVSETILGDSRFAGTSRDTVNEFANCWRVFAGDVDNPETYLRCSEWLQDYDKDVIDSRTEDGRPVYRRNMTGSKLLVVYATPPVTFYPLALLTEDSDIFGMFDPGPMQMFEKPFGDNLAQTEKLNEVMLTLFRNKDLIFRMRHYLGYRLTMLLQANPLSALMDGSPESQGWTFDSLSGMQAWLSESVKVETDRMGFYVPIGGQWRDCMGHALTLPLAVVASLENTGEVPLDVIQHKRTERMSQVKPGDSRWTTFGQYRSFSAQLNDSEWKVPGLWTPTWMVTNQVIKAAGELPLVIGTGKAMGVRGKPTKFAGVILQRGTGRDAERLEIRIDPKPGIFHVRRGRGSEVYKITDVTNPEVREILADPLASDPYAEMFCGALNGLRHGTQGSRECQMMAANVESLAPAAEEIREDRRTLHPYDDGTQGPINAGVFNCGWGMLQPHGYGSL